MKVLLFFERIIHMYLSNHFSCIFIFLLIHSATWSQVRPYADILSELDNSTGKERYELLMELCKQEVYNDQSLARSRGMEGLAISKDIGFEYGIGKSYRCIGLSYHFIDKLDSARYYYEKSTPYSDDPLDKAWCYFNIATIFQNTGRYDSAYHYAALCEPIYEVHGDFVDKADIQKMYADLASYNGDWGTAGERFLSADTLYQLGGDDNRRADALKGLSYVYAASDNFEETIKILKQAHSLYQQSNDPFFGAEALNNIGHYYYKLNTTDSARFYLEKSLNQAREVNNSYVIGNALQDLGIMDYEASNFNSGRARLLEAQEYFRSKGDTYEEADIYLSLGDLERKAKNHDEAISYYNQGASIADDLGALELQEWIQVGLSLSQEAKGDYRSSLASFKVHSEIRDSTKSVKKDSRVSELLIQYESIKKDNEVIRANALVEKRNNRIRLLTIGLISFLIIGGLTIYSISQRRRREKAILENEKAIEIEKRKSAEQQLEYKKKELTAKVLQLASKNEFLQSLEQEVVQLKSSVDESVGKTSRKISRMIHNDTLDDEEWDQFGKEFSSIHQGFMDRLKNQFGDFSNHEWRLISLLKMNLSSKVRRLGTD